MRVILSSQFHGWLIWQLLLLAAVAVACHKLGGEAGDSWKLAISSTIKNPVWILQSLSWQISEGRVYFSLVSSCCSSIYNCFFLKECRLLHSLYFVRRRFTSFTNLGTFFTSCYQKNFSWVMHERKEIIQLFKQCNLTLSIWAGFLFFDL